MSRRAAENHGSAFNSVNSAKTRRSALGSNHVEEVETVLSESTKKSLEEHAREREAIEAMLTRLDVRIYDYESEFLKQCVELGGSLFDGFGVERQARHQSGMGAIHPNVPSGSLPIINGPTPTSSVPGSLSYHSRLHAWSPSERVFTASSLGALNRVERYKLQEAENDGLPPEEKPVKKKTTEIKRGISTRKRSHAAEEEEASHGRSKRTRTE